MIKLVLERKPEFASGSVTKLVLRGSHQELPLEGSIAEELKKGEQIQLVGFGTFKVSERAAREGRNPQTGETMQIKASKTPKFTAGKALKDALN